MFFGSKSTLTMKQWQFTRIIYSLFGLIAIFLLLTFTMRMVHFYITRRIKRRYYVMENNTRSSGEISEVQDANPFPPQLQDDQREFKDSSIIKWLITFFDVSSMILLQTVIHVSFMYGYFSPTLLNTFWSGVFMSVLIVAYPLIRSEMRLPESMSRMSNRLRMLGMSLPIVCLGCTLYFIIFVYLFKGLCECGHNGNIPGLDIAGTHFSTHFSRSMAPEVCPNKQKPCHVYITLPENAREDIFINFHVNKESCNGQECAPLVEIIEINGFIDNQESSREWINFEAVKGEYSHDSMPREVYTSLVKGLAKNATYVFRVIEPSWAHSEPQLYSYHLPMTNLKIIMGGDVGNTQISKMMNDDVIPAFGPDLIMIGGDIAYDNSIPECYQAWDYLLKSLPNYVKNGTTNIVRVIPFIFGAGNHDFGVISEKSIKITHDSSQPVFKHFFPQNTYQGEVPPLEHRKSHFAHRFGTDLLIISLDTGYEKSMKSEQYEWLVQELDRPYSIKFAQYHNPIYSFCYPERDIEAKRYGRDLWAPLFEKHDFSLISENHNHLAKRTKHLRNGRPSEDGPVYIGEGSWGVTREICPSPINQDLMEMNSDRHIVWAVTITKGRTLEITGWNEKKEAIDQFKI